MRRICTEKTRSSSTDECALAACALCSSDSATSIFGAFAAHNTHALAQFSYRYFFILHLLLNLHHPTLSSSSERLNLSYLPPPKKNTLVVYMYPVEPNLCELKVSQIRLYRNTWATEIPRAESLLLPAPSSASCLCTATGLWASSNLVIDRVYS